MGVSFSDQADWFPGTIVQIISNSQIVIQKDNYKVIAGSIFDGSASYQFTPNPKGQLFNFFLVNNQWTNNNPNNLSILQLGNKRAFYNHI